MGQPGEPEEREDISWPSSPVTCTECVLSGRASRRREKDISWPSSPTGTVSCTASVVSHGTGGGQEGGGHQLVVPIGDGCTACVLSHRTGEAEERKQRRRRRGRKEGGRQEGRRKVTD